MDREYIDDHHIVARYLADQLAEPEREQFEMHYLEHPEVVDEIEVVTRFKVGITELQRSGELDRLIKGPSRFVWPAVTAAAAVTAITASIVFFVSGDSKPLLVAKPSMLVANDGRALALGATHRIVRMRRTGHDAEIQLDGARKALALAFLPEYASSTYRVSMERMTGAEQQPIAEIGGLQASPDGFVRVYLDSNAVVPGTYQLRLITEQDADETSLFSLRVKSADH